MLCLFQHSPLRNGRQKKPYQSISGSKHSPPDFDYSATKRQAKNSTGSSSDKNYEPPPTSSNVQPPPPPPPPPPIPAQSYHHKNQRSSMDSGKGSISQTYERRHSGMARKISAGSTSQ